MKLAVFDLDGTLVRGSSSFSFCHYLVKKKVLPFSAKFYAGWNYLCHLYGKRSLLQLHHCIFERLLKGRFFSSLEEHVEPFLHEFLFKSWYIPALSRLQLAQHLGEYTLILSNSPSFLVKPIARILRVDAWQATEYAVDEERRLSHVASIMQGEEKAEYVLKVAREFGFEIAAISAHTDSLLDLPLLLAAGEPIGVNPDRGLRTLCKQNNWEIL
jgi:HAD superfamily phosphoserine phosphatase-like hydrolase